MVDRSGAVFYTVVCMTNVDRPLDRSDLKPEPISQFLEWFNEYKAGQPPEPTAMAIATASKDGEPSVRFVLLKSFGADGFVFFTNYKSEKAKNLEQNPRASLVFYWNPQNRQVRVSGRVEKTSALESDEYFATRPVESQLGAWASQQSEPVESRETLEARMNELRAKYAGKAVPRPPHWGGFRVIPERIEFWQGRTGRLHDRFVFERVPGGWNIQRLCP